MRDPGGMAACAAVIVLETGVLQSDIVAECVARALPTVVVGSIRTVEVGYVESADLETFQVSPAADQVQRVREVSPQLFERGGGGLAVYWISRHAK